MIATLRGHTPQQSYIRHAKRLASPSTLRRYPRVNTQFRVARRPYSTKNEHAPALDNGPNASTDVKFKTQGYVVIRGGFGDNDEDAAEEIGEELRSRARKRKRAPDTRPGQWERLRDFESVKQEQPAVTKEEVPNINSSLSGFGDVYGLPPNPPGNPSQRTTQEDIVSLCTHTIWERNQEWGFLHRGFEFVDFRAARSFIIEAMQLKDDLGAHMHLSNFGRYVYVRIGAPDGSYEAHQDPRAWYIGDGDVDLGWALPKAAKKYMGKWQMDAAAKPVSDLGYSDSWEKTSRLVVPSKGRYNELLDLRRPPMKWLTMEYRQLSELNIPATEITTALVNQIAEDLMQPRVGEENMAFPVWCITDHTLAVSQTEFFCNSTASITKPGNGPLQCRETVILHRTFNLEQFHSMQSKEGWALKKDVKDSRHVRSLAQSVTINWRHSTKHSKRHKSLLNLSSDTVYLKDWGPFLTKELQPLVRRVLAREVPEHVEHVSALSDIYSREAILEKYGEASNFIPSENEPSEGRAIGFNVRQWNNAVINQQVEDHEAGPQDWAKRRNQKISDDFSGLVNMLRERFDGQQNEHEPEDSLGRDPNDILVRRPSVKSMPVKIRRVALSKEEQLWRSQYFKLRRVIDDRRRTLESLTNKNETTDNLSTDLVNLLSKVGLQSERLNNWRSRYYELRRSAGSLGLLNKPETHEDMESGPDKQEHDELLDDHRSNRREPLFNRHTVYYHWLPGEKLNLSPFAVEDNRKQAWRPWNFKEFVTKQAREDLYQDSPSVASAPSSLITGYRRIPSGTRPLSAHWNENTPHVRLEDQGTKVLHWVPGASFPVDKRGKIHISLKDENRKEEPQECRQEYPPIHKYTLAKEQEIKKPLIRKVEHNFDEPLLRKIPHDNMTKQAALFFEERRIILEKNLQLTAKTDTRAAASKGDAEDTVGGSAHQTRPKTDDERQFEDELLQTYRMQHDTLWSKVSGDKIEGKGETKLAVQSQPQSAMESDTVSMGAEAEMEPDAPSTAVDSAPTEDEPSASAGIDIRSMSAADAVPEPEEPSYGSVEELESEAGGLLNSANAERLLEEVGMSVEKNGDEFGEKDEVDTEKDVETEDDRKENKKDAETPRL